MTAFLLLTLYAPLTSWGEIAVGETRGSWDRPSRSAVLGMLAAGLGLVREDQDAHEALDTQYGLAIRADALGAPMVDFHTAQTVGAAAVKRHRPATRAALLASGEPETMLSRRTYRTNALMTVAVWVRGTEPRWSLEQLADAVRRPVFVLFGGRKSNALGLPLGPAVVDTATLCEAFRRYEASRGMRESATAAARAAVSEVVARVRPREGWGTEISLDSPDGIMTGLTVTRRERRRDTSPHRVRWQFTERTVFVAQMIDEVVASGGAGEPTNA